MSSIALKKNHLLECFEKDEMKPETLRKRRVAAVRAVLKKKNLPSDMRRYWTHTLIALNGWELEKRNAGIK